jgi:hypothetical protein
MVDWYANVLGMTTGTRPDFEFPGAWMYLGDAAFVHLIEVQKDSGAGSESNLKLEHFAFSATDMQTFEAHLVQLGEKFQKLKLPGFDIVQYNIWDPDGNHLHIDFETNTGI